MTPGNSPPEIPAPLAPETIRQHALALGCGLDPGQASALHDYARLLQRWNRVYNLTAVESDAEVLSHHLLDSLALLPTLREELARLPEQGGGARLLDAGTGAGLPGIPLAIATPGLQVHMVDAVQKKCAFVAQALAELRLPRARVTHARLEQLRTEPQQVIVSRAFSSLADFTRLTAHLLAAEGLWIAMKGRLPAAELAELPPTVRHERTVKIQIPLLAQERHLVLLRRHPAAHPGA